MDSLKIIGYTKDYRTSTNVIYAQIKIDDYLSLVGRDFDRFEIQRKREKHKGYKRLERDIAKGALIPTITLAVEPTTVADFLDFLAEQKSAEIIEELYKRPDKIYILDGLQRTYIMNGLREGGAIFKKGQSLLLEIWFEANISHLIYRLIVLNSGQKPMSMRHQIELLFITMRETLLRDIADLEVLQEKDENRRKKGKEFPFERLVTAYKSYLTKSPEVQKDDIVSEKMREGDILDSEEEFLSDSFIKFKSLLASYSSMDVENFRIFHGTELAKFRNWFAESNVINSFFAAVSKFAINPDREKVAGSSIAKLTRDLTAAGIGSDPMSLVKYSKLVTSEEVARKFNVGVATRKFLTIAFVEYLRSEGELSFDECWTIASAELFAEAR